MPTELTVLTVLYLLYYSTYSTFIGVSPRVWNGDSCDGRRVAAGSHASSATARYMCCVPVHRRPRTTRPRWPPKTTSRCDRARSSFRVDPVILPSIRSTVLLPPSREGLLSSRQASRVDSVAIRPQVSSDLPPAPHACVRLFPFSNCVPSSGYGVPRGDSRRTDSSKIELGVSLRPASCPPRRRI